LWHYTNFAGLQGILNGTLWASSMAFLNDTQEFEYAINIALKVLDEDIVAAETAGGPNFRLDSAVEVLNRILRAEGGADVFVSSFSTKYDDLSQWRAYGGIGPSFAIGFNSSRLRAVAAAAHFHLVKVKYDRDGIEESFRAILHSYYGSRTESPSVKDARLFQVVEFTTHIVGPLLDLAARSKDVSFEAEDEWRLVHRMAPASKRSARPPLQFRQAGSLVIPYLEIPLHSRSSGVSVQVSAAKSIFNSITVGPTPHPEKIKSAVSRMVEIKGLTLDVESSAVPFRNW
jgi:hypothetical protein